MGDQRDQTGRIERFQPAPIAGDLAADLQWGRGLTVVCGLLMVVLLCAGWWVWRFEKQDQARARFDQERQVALKAVRRCWETQRVRAWFAERQTAAAQRGSMMPNYLVEDAGMPEANGTYVEDGAVEGLPAYRNTTSNWWLFHYDAFWWIAAATSTSITINDACYYTPDALPSTTWWSGAAGVTPLPTVSEQTTTNPFEPSFDTGTDNFAAVPDIRPCQAVLAGTNYGIFVINDASPASVNSLLRLVNVSAQTWGGLDLGETLFGNLDLHQTASAFDAGDGAHVWVTSGVYLDGLTPKMVWKRIAISPGDSASVVSDATSTIALPSADISTLLDVGFGEFWFMMLDGDAARLCSCLAGGDGYTVLATFTTAADLPAGFSPVVFPNDVQSDHALLYDTTNEITYWSRRCANGGDQRFAMYAITAESCTLQADVIPISATTGLCQSWASLNWLMMGEIGDEDGNRRFIWWTPGGEVRETENPFLQGADITASRCWFV